MPRYLIERSYPDGLVIPQNEHGARIVQSLVSTNGAEGVTWVHSYVSIDKKKSYCIYDAPSPEAIHHAAQRNNLPLDCVIEVQVLDPYFYRD